MHWIDPDPLPPVTGTIAQLLLNDHGEVDGVLLDDGQEVHIPPHLARRARRALAPGQTLRARYLKPREADVFVVVALELPDGKRITDDGPHGHEPPAPPAATRPAHFSATVRALIHAPRGEVAGAVLDDGSLLRFPPHGNEALAALLQPGQPVEVWGQALRRAGMQVVRVEHLAAG